MTMLSLKCLLAVAVIFSPLLNTGTAEAAFQSGYGNYSEVIHTGVGFYSVSYEVFNQVTYTLVSSSQVQILAGYAPMRGCLKNAQSFYNQTGFSSSWTRGWYIWHDANGDIDSDNLAGSTSGAWQACSSTSDWLVKAQTGQNHWPPTGTRVKARTAYCISRSINGGLEAGCSGYRSTLTGYMW